MARTDSSGVVHSIPSFIANEVHYLYERCPSPLIRHPITEMPSENSSRTNEDLKELKEIILSFRVQDLQTLLGSSNVQKFGKKSDLQARAMELLRGRDSKYCSMVRDLHKKASGSHLKLEVRFPMHTGVKLAQLPFYQQLEEIIRPSNLIPVSVQKTQQAKFVFYLTPQQATSLASSRDMLINNEKKYPIQVQVRFCLLGPTGQQDDVYPPGISVSVNRKICALPSPLPSSKPNLPVKRPRVPLNITYLVKLSPTVSNDISVSWNTQSDQSFIIAVNLVRKLTPADLLQKLHSRARRHSAVTTSLIKEKLQGDVDCQLATKSLPVSLICPLAKSRIVTPCLASTCRHLQCFDAISYLSMNEMKPSWICPICYQPASYDNLLLDEYFSIILISPLLPSDCNEVNLHDDGSWSITPPTQNSSAPSENTDIIVLDGDLVPDLSSKCAEETSCIDLTYSDNEDNIQSEKSEKEIVEVTPDDVSVPSPSFLTTSMVPFLTPPS